MEPLGGRGWAGAPLRLLLLAVVQIDRHQSVAPTSWFRVCVDASDQQNCYPGCSVEAANRRIWHFLLLNQEAGVVSPQDHKVREANKPRIGVQWLRNQEG